MKIFKNYKKSLKIKTAFLITFILTLAMGVTLFANILQIRKSMRTALENEIIASGILMRNTVINNLKYFTLDRFSGMPEFFRDIINTNPKISYCYISDQNGKILYHNNIYNVGRRLNPKIFQKSILDAQRSNLTVGRFYETILPISQFVYSDLKRIGNIHIGVKRSIIDNALLKIVIFTVAIFLISLVIIITLLLIFISRNVINPVSGLSKEMQQVTQEMKFDTEIKVKGQDEISNLANNFNIMIQEIRHYSDNLEDIVVERTKELNSANQMLEKASLELQATNTKLLKDLEMAKRLQESVIKNIQLFAEFNVDSLYMAMESLGGDIYDVRRLGRKTFSFMISDVSGHGVPAALITTMAKMSFINHGHFSKTPAQICTEVNHDMVELILDTDYYLTAFYAILDTENLVLSYTNCGHQKPLLYREKTDEIINLDGKGFFLGSFENSEYETESIKLELNDKILFYTDGITEARNHEGEFYSFERLVEFTQRHKHIPYNEFLKKFIQEFNQFCGNRPVDDDIAILLVEVTGSHSSMEHTETDVEISANAASGFRGSMTEQQTINIFREIYHKLELEKEPLEKQINSSIQLYKENNFDESEKILKKLLPFFPNQLSILTTIAAICYKKREFHEALRYYHRIKEINPDYPRVEQTINLIKTNMEKG